MPYSGFRFVLAAQALGRPVAAVNLGRTRADGRLQLKVESDCAAALRAAVERLARGREASRAGIAIAARPGGLA